MNTQYDPRQFANIAKSQKEDNLGTDDMPHIGMAYLLAVARQRGIEAGVVSMVTDGWDVDRLLACVQQERPLVVGFSAYSVQIKAAAAIATRIRDSAPSVLIGVGGPHASAIPAETLKEFPVFDFVVRGEAEEVLPAILEDIDSLSAIPGVGTREMIPAAIAMAPRIQNLDDLPFPAWDGFALDRYLGGAPHRTNREIPMSTSRGCPYDCQFCCRSFGRRRLHRSVDSVVEELWRNVIDFGAEAIAFLDETFVVDKEWSEELFRRMIKERLHERIKWSCETTVHLDDRRFYELMKQAGCYYVFYGFETANSEMLRLVGKSVQNKVQMKKAVCAAYDAGLIVTGSFIFNLAGETEATARETIEFATELYPYVHSITFPIAVPFPGTRIREWGEEGRYGLRILSNDWERYGKQEGVMESETLRIERLEQIQKCAYAAIPKKDLENHELAMVHNKKGE